MPRLPRTASAVAAILVLLASSVHAGKTCPGEHCVSVRPQDDVFLVSARSLACSTDTSRFASGMHTERYDAVGQDGKRSWRRSELGEFLSAVEPTTPTVFFVHGNRVEADEMRSRGLWVYSRLMREACDDRPLRFVIFAWPSDEIRDSKGIKGALRDARIKAARTQPAGFQLAWLIDHTQPDAPLGMIGYSYGARVLSGATHLLAGGSLGGLSLPRRSAMPKRPTQAVYVAAAFDADWLGRGAYHERSTEQIDDLLVATNRLDPAMRLYGFVNPNTDARAMGFAGPTHLPRNAQPRVRLLDVTKAVGRTHDMCIYLSHRGLMRNAWRRLSFANTPTPTMANSQAKPAPTPAPTTLADAARRPQSR